MLGILAFFYLGWLFQTQWAEINFSEFETAIQSQPQYLLFACLLVPLNWILEMIKWRSLVLDLQHISWRESAQSILAGIFASLITPNRIGELAGRLAYIKKENRVNVLYFNSLCASSQLVVTAIFGIIALSIYWTLFFQADVTQPAIISWAAWISVVALVFLFLRSNLLFKMSSYIGKGKLDSVEFLEISLQKKAILFALSLVRYLVFCIQFYCLLQVFQVEFNFMESSTALAILFFLTALVPTGWLSDLPVRSSLAFFVFETFAGLGFQGLVSALLLWTINLLIPALFALVLFRKLDWFRIPKWEALWK